MNGRTPNQPQIRDHTQCVRNWRALFVSWLATFVGVFGWLLVALRPDEPLLARLFCVFGFLASMSLSVVIHEAAHFLTARALGMHPYVLTIGDGEKVFEHRFGSFRLVLNSIPYSGMVYHLPPLPGSSRHRWRDLLVLLAGPLSNAVLLTISLLVAFHTPASFGPAVAKDIGSSVPGEIMLANGCILLFAMVPLRVKISGIETPNDGMQILMILLGRETWFGESNAAETITESSADPTATGEPGWRWTVDHVQPELLLATSRQRLTDPSLTTEDRNRALDEFATCVLMYGASECLSEADVYSEELICNKPNDWSVKGTRGSVLVEKGNTQAGVSLLTEVMEKDPSVFDRSIAASFLALAAWKQNKQEEARAWLRRSLELDPDCASALRLAATIELSTGSSSSGGICPRSEHRPTPEHGT